MRCLLATLSLMAASAAAATDLVNKDNVAYVVTVTSGAKVQRAPIAAKSVKLSVCPSTAMTCVVLVEGVGEIEVTGADDVVIQNARLSKK